MRALKQFFGGDFERLFRRQVVIELFQGGEEALAFFFPRERRGIVPFAAAFGHGEAPVHQVADVRENFRRRARSFGRTIVGKARPSVADGFRSAIGDGSEGVAQERAGVGHDCSTFCCPDLLLHHCHPERSEGSAFYGELQIPRFARDDKTLKG